MSISSFFARLGAPLANTRWSWGAQRPSDGVVFLRVWQDLKFVEDQRPYYLIERPAGPGDYEQNPGHAERLRHIEAIRAGAPCFPVMCTVVDTSPRPRKIAFFNEDDVFLGRDLIDRPDGTWIQMIERRPVSSVVAW